MTGFGRATGSWLNKSFTVEIRTLNSKMLDLTMKLPQEFRSKEIDFRKLMSEGLLRGKIDVAIQVDNQSLQAVPQINLEVAKSYYEQIRRLETEINRDSPDPIALILRVPEVLSNAKQEPDEAEIAFLTKFNRTGLAAHHRFSRARRTGFDQRFHGKHQPNWAFDDTFGTL